MRRAIVLGVVTAIALGGCIGTDLPTPGPTSVVPPGTELPPSITESPEEVETRSPGDSGTGGQDQPSVFAGPRDTPPGTIADFLDTIPGGGIAGPCDVNPPEEGVPGIAMHEIVIPTSLCGQEFDPGEEVALLVRGPGGKEWTAQVTPDEFGAFEWEFEELPGRLQGEYFARATQGEAAPVERFFDVQLDSLEAAVVPRYFPRGGATELGIAGGQPGQRVPVYLYRERSPEEGLDYVADLGPIRLNDNGQKQVELRSRRGDQGGTYVVVVDPDTANIGYWFVLGRSDAAQ